MYRLYQPLFSLLQCEKSSLESDFIKYQSKNNKYYSTSTALYTASRNRNRNYCDETGEGLLCEAICDKGLCNGIAGCGNCESYDCRYYISHGHNFI